MGVYKLAMEEEEERMTLGGMTRDMAMREITQEQVGGGGCSGESVRQCD